MRNVALAIVFLVSILSCPSPSAYGENYPVKPLFPGNWADPTVVRVGDDYYLTSNNDRHVPSVMVFHSEDLRRWEPVSYACPQEGQGPATDIALHDGRLFIYGGGGREAWAMVSEPPYARWSGRINMEPVEPHGIDAGHIADGQGKRYLYTNQGKIVEISKDGLMVLTVPERVYEGWPIPDTIAIECSCLESPSCSSGEPGTTWSVPRAALPDRLPVTWQWWHAPRT